MNPKDAPIESFKNRKNLNGSCGCYRCISTFDVSEITDWTDDDETAYCPKCNADSVIPDVENLLEVHEHWFGKEASSEPTSQERLRQKKE